MIEGLRRDHPLDDAAALEKHWVEVVEDERHSRINALKGSRKLHELRRALADLDGTCEDTSEPRELLRHEMIDTSNKLVSGVDACEAEPLLRSLATKKARTKRKANWSPVDAHDRLKAVQEDLVKFAKTHLPKERDEAVEHDAARLTCDFYATYVKAAGAFQEAKAAQISLDFDNLIADVLHMLRVNDGVRARVARGIKHLLIDEFQDTDSAQLEIAQLLAKETEGPDLFIVGDAKQSIYNFRGADVEVFQGEKNAADDMIRLDRNFRSLPGVMAFVNAFFADSGILDAVEPCYKPRATHREATDDCRIELLAPATEQGANTADYRRMEAELIAGRIVEMCGIDTPAQVYDRQDDTWRAADFGDVAMLFRTLNDVHLYEEQLRRRGIPYQVVAGAGFYERQEILDVRNLLTVLVDPWDEVAMAGFLRGPMAGLSDESLVRLYHGRPGGRPYHLDGSLLGDEQAGRLAGARALLEDLRAHTEMPLAAFLRYMLERTGYEAILLGQFLGVQKAGNVRKVLDLADDFARTRMPTLAAFVGFLEEIARYPEVREGDAAIQPGGGALTLMTIHKAKGLEFPIVFIPDCSRGIQSRNTQSIVAHRRLGLAARVTGPQGETESPAIFETITRDRNALDRAEHARILYVAMTRARDWLILSGAPADVRGFKGSWTEALNGAYGLLDKADGEEFEVDGRRTPAADCPPGRTLPLLRVRRVASQGKVAATTSAPPQTAPEALDARVGPVEPGPTAGRTVAVTTLLDMMAFDAEYGAVPPPDTPGHLDAALRGTLVHRMLERWDGTGDARPVIESICEEECPALHLRARIVSDLADVAERYRESTLGRRITDEEGLEREAPFLLRLGGVVVNGAIDVLLQDGTVVDYKTGRHRAGSHARYETQLCLYAAAVRTLQNRQPPAAYVYYVDSGDAREVDVSSGRIDAAIYRAKEAIETAYGIPGR